VPFEINEIDIRLRVGEGDRDAPPVQAAGAGNGDGGDPRGGPDRAALVDDVARRVLQILRAQRDR